MTKNIEVNFVLNKQKVIDMGKGKRIANYIAFPFLAVALLVGGIILIIQRTGTGQLIGGIALVAACPIIIALTIYLTKTETNENVKTYGVENGEIQMNYKIVPGLITITRTEGNRTDSEKLAFSNIYKVKRTKKCFMVFVNKDEMYYIPSDSFVQGTPDDLFKLFYDCKIILDY
ncbi:MAG: YcxB family protein [Christensenellaceae bacterium]|nr:YcxB family protein [Christensenellaceae bacterium]MDD6926722.1 YcxB family protein [bacterium]MDY2850729.1 YcxB family protein [Christensenellaceae bacterium]